MTDQAMVPDPGAFEDVSPAPARTSSRSPQPATGVSPPGQHELDRAGVPRWNAPPDPTGEQARWDAQQRARLGHASDPAAAPAKPDQAGKTANGAADAIKVGDVTVTSQEMKEFLENRAARESGRAQAPATPDGYVMDLPKEFQAPPGIEVALDKNDPALAQLRGVAHKYQLPQAAVSDLLGLYAGKIAGDLAVGQAAHLAEVEKLGSAGPARVDAIALWLKGQLGDQGKVLSGVRGPDGFVRSGVLWTADVCKAFEALMNKQRSQGAASYTGNGRDMGNHDAGKIPGYENMTFAQRRHAQEQRRTGGR